MNLIKRLIIFIINCLKSVYLLLNDFEIVYYTIYILFVVVGITLHPFFFVFCMTDFLRTEYLKNVVRAVWQPRAELVLSLILFIILEYYFTLIGYMVYYDDYQGMCDELWVCFFTTFDWTFKDTGAIGGKLTDNDSLQILITDGESADSYNGVDHSLPVNYFTRFAFDNIFKIILVLIVINMVAGNFNERVGCLDGLGLDWAGVGMSWGWIGLGCRGWRGWG